MSNLHIPKWPSTIPENLFFFYFAWSFLPLWHFSPYWLSTKVLCWESLCRIFVGDTILFYLFICQCGVVPCLSIVLVLDRFPLRTGVVGPLPGVVPCFVLLFLNTCFVVPEKEGCVTLHGVCMLNVVCLLYTLP